MRFQLTVLLGLLGLASAAGATSTSGFKRDVIYGAAQKARMARQKQQVNDELLSKAVLLDDYEKELNRRGMTLGADFVKEHQNQHRKLEDFEVDYDYMYSFSGYSLRYAKCQPVQYFSENAVLAGEYSPMVTQDIVVLRLCPQATCSDSSTYGCYYNYADYALTLNEYVKIMLKYTAKIRDYTCEWCEECRNGNGENNNNQNGRRRRLEEEQQDNEGEEDQEQQEQEEDNEAQENNNNQQYNDDGYYSCDGYNTYCYTYTCDGDDQDQNQNGDDGNGNAYMDYEEYLDYIDCAEVNYNNYAYYVRPRCDGDSNTFKMEVYYDNYCIQYAGSDITVKSLGLGFKEGMFENYYGTTCIDCSETDYPPYFDASSTLCNMVHYVSAKCTSDLMYDLFENEEDESSECTFIESIRFGAYDEDGNFASSSSSYSSGSWNAKVTIAQKALLGVSVGICVIFVIYACYLHHSMTNLLIKSLSHRELLPPSRGARGGRSTVVPVKTRRGGGGALASGGGSGKRSSSKVDDEPDWDSGNGEAA